MIIALLLLLPELVFGQSNVTLSERYKVKVVVNAPLIDILNNKPLETAEKRAKQPGNFGYHYEEGMSNALGPTDLDIDDKGNMYIYDSYNQRIQEFSKNGKYIQILPMPKGKQHTAGLGNISINGKMTSIEDLRKKDMIKNDFGLIQGSSYPDGSFRGNGVVRKKDNELIVNLGKNKISITAESKILGINWIGRDRYENNYFRITEQKGYKLSIKKYNAKSIHVADIIVRNENEPDWAKKRMIDSWGNYYQFEVVNRDTVRVRVWSREITGN
jgi:hypothetical protein